MRSNLIDDEISGLSLAGAFQQAFGAHMPVQPQPLSRGMSDILNNINSTLYGILTDMRLFSVIANTTTRSRQKLPSDLYGKVIISIHSRLMEIEDSHEHQTIEKCLWLGLVSYITSIFLHIPGATIEYCHLMEELQSSMRELDLSVPGVKDLKIWLLFVGSAAIFGSREAWLVAETRALVKGMKWTDLHDSLENMMWIQIIHDGPGHGLFLKALEQSRRNNVI